MHCHPGQHPPGLPGGPDRRPPVDTGRLQPGQQRIPRARGITSRRQWRDLGPAMLRHRRERRSDSGRQQRQRDVAGGARPGIRAALYDHPAQGHGAGSLRAHQAVGHRGGRGGVDGVDAGSRHDGDRRPTCREGGRRTVRGHCPRPGCRDFNRRYRAAALLRLLIERRHAGRADNDPSRAHLGRGPRRT